MVTAALRCDPKPVASPHIRALERAYLKAHRAESKAIAALPENPPKAMTDRCWALADATNQARTALTAAIEAVR